jgi:hypothetical protein
VGELQVIFFAPAPRSGNSITHRGFYVCDRKERPMSPCFATYADAERQLRKMEGGRR